MKTELMAFAVGFWLGVLTTKAAHQVAETSVEEDIADALCEDDNENVAIYFAPRSAVKDPLGARVGAYRLDES